MEMQKSVAVIITVGIIILGTVGIFGWMFLKQLGMDSALWQKSPEKDTQIAIDSNKSEQNKATDNRLQSTAAIVTETGVPEVEFVRTVKVQGAITGAYRDINDIQILSTGELAYKKSVFPKDSFVIREGDVQESFFVGDKIIPNKDTLTPIKEIDGKLTYLVESAPRSLNTLIFGNDKKAPDSYFSKFEDIGGKLAYTYRKPDDPFETLIYDDKEITTSDRYFPLVKDVGGKLAYVKRTKTADPSSYKETLFYDGQEIRTLGTPEDIEIIAGKLAYIVRDGTQKKDILFYDGKQVNMADSIRGLGGINGKLIYQVENTGGSIALVIDGKVISNSSFGGYLVKDIGGRLAYTFMEAVPNNKLKSSLVYDGKEIASTTPEMGWAVIRGEVIVNIEDIRGKLAYTVEGHESSDSLYYDGMKILTADVIGNSYQGVEVAGNYYAPKLSESMKPFYFFGANEKDGLTIFSIYRITPSE